MEQLPGWPVAMTPPSRGPSFLALLSASATSSRESSSGTDVRPVATTLCPCAGRDGCAGYGDMPYVPEAASGTESAPPERRPRPVRGRAMFAASVDSCDLDP